MRLLLSSFAAVIMSWSVFCDVQGLDTGGSKLLAVLTAALILLLAESGALRRRSAADRQLDGAAHFLSLTAALGLLVLVIRDFRIETPAFHDQLIPLAFAGFLVHHILPRRLRLPFFALLSLGAIMIVLGVGQGSFLVAVGSLLIFVCHLPLRFQVRLALLAALGVLLAAWRLFPSVTHPLWPVLGSMFMFRLILYLHALHYRHLRFDLFRSLAYFFMLPNVVFPLFPVVDYEKFHNGFKAREPYATSERGLRWLLFGVLHLLAYRWIKSALLIPPDAVDGALSLLRYLAANFLLILRVSGQFHLATGLLLLFGFDLPRVMGNFLAASSFAEFWRQANVYWHDFMLKIFYLPTFSRLRGRPVRTRMAAATGFVFLASGVLHSYQWFWLRGEFPVRIQDLLFWGFFSVLVIVEQLRQASIPRVHATPVVEGGVVRFFLRNLRIMGVMAGIIILWSIWTATSLPEWRAMWLLPQAGLLKGILQVALIAVGGALTLGTVRCLLGDRTSAASPPRQRVRFLTGSLRFLPLLAVFVVSQPNAYSVLGTTCRRFMGEVKIDRPSVLDRKLMLRWYYEGLHDSASYNSDLWRFYNADWPVTWGNQYIMRTRDDFFFQELRPGRSVEFRGAWLTTNRWGLRDKDYGTRSDPGVYRIALLGASVDMGAGVGDGQTYEALLEDRLNREAATKPRFEILNFAVDGYDPLRRLMVLEKKALAFRPHAIWYAAHPDVDMSLLKDHLLRMVPRRLEPPFEFWKGITAGWQAGQGMRAGSLGGKLAAHRVQLLAAIYARLATVSRDHGLAAACLILPEPWGIDAERIRGEIQAARAAGLRVMDLTGAFAGHDPESLNVAPWDFHPNVVGHKLLAAELYRQVLKEGLLR